MKIFEILNPNRNTRSGSVKKLYFRPFQVRTLPAGAAGVAEAALVVNKAARAVGRMLGRN
jgi:hypothetical protein